jgi:hypothetical protein
MWRIFYCILDHYIGYHLEYLERVYSANA